MQCEALKIGGTVTTARTKLEHHASAPAHPDLATRHHHRASKLFEKDHAYAARLVQIATAIRSVARSTTKMEQPVRGPSEIEQNDRITTGTVTQARAHRRGS
jgi:hypothetical protein